MKRVVFVCRQDPWYVGAWIPAWMYQVLESLGNIDDMSDDPFEHCVYAELYC